MIKEPWIKRLKGNLSVESRCLTPTSKTVSLWPQNFLPDLQR